VAYNNRKYPQFSACGLNCGLCPRYYTAGSSRCPGCAGKGFSEIHCSCGILACCQRKGLEFCFECGEFPCKKYDGVGSSDSFITHKNQLSDMEKAKRVGIEVYMEEQYEKIGLLEELLNNYDDGRRKSFYCLAVNLLELRDIKDIVGQLTSEVDPETPVKERAAAAKRLFEEIAESKGISLKLRKE